MNAAASDASAADRLTSVEELVRRGYHFRDPWTGLLAVVPGPPAVMLLASREPWRLGEWCDRDVDVITVLRLRIARVLPHEAEPPDIIAETLALRRRVLASATKGPPSQPGASGLLVVVPAIGGGHALAREMRRHLRPPEVAAVAIAQAADNAPYDDEGQPRVPVATALGLLEHELAVGRVKLHPAAEGLSVLHDALRRLPRIPPAEIDGIALATLLLTWVSGRMLGRRAGPERPATRL